MTAKAALCNALLSGRIINVKTCFRDYGITNCAREITRMVEIPFGVEITRTHMTGKSRYGQPVQWVDYNLHRFERNKEGIEKMKEYVKKQLMERAMELIIPIFNQASLF